MPPGIGNTGLGTATATIQFNTSQLRNANSLVGAFGRNVSGVYNQAANQINRTMQVQAAQTAVMRANLAVLQAQIAAIQQSAASENIASQQQLQHLRAQAVQLRLNIATRQQQTTKLGEELVVQRQLSNQQKQTTQEYLQSTAALVAMGAAAAQVFNIGVAGAGFIQQQVVSFSALTGSLKGGEALVERLKNMSRDMAIPFNETVVAVRTLLPTLEGNTTELENQLDIIRRVYTLNPKQGMAGAGFSVNELLVSGGTNLQSIRARFNLSSGVYKDELMKANGDIWTALDKTLDRMGATSVMADEMGKTFVASMSMAKDATKQLLAEGFMPLIERATPKVQAYTTWISNMRQVNKEALSTAAVFTTLVALGVPIIAFTGRWYNMLKGILATSLLIGQANKGWMGKVGVYGGAAVVGAGIGIAMGNESRRQRGEDPMTSAQLIRTAQEALAIVLFKMHQAITTVYSGFIRLDMALSNLQIALYMFESWLRKMTGQDTTEIDRLTNIERSKNEKRESGISPDAIKQNHQQAWESINYMIFGGPNGGQSAGSNNRNIYQRSNNAGGLNAEQSETVYTYFRELDAMTAKHNQQRLQAENDFANSRNDLIRSHGKEMLREEQDYLRNRARQEADFQRSIGEIIRDSDRQEADWDADLADTLAEIHEDGNDKIKDIDKSYQKEREDDEREHRLRLMEAAAMLDAKGVWQENQQYALKRKKADEQHGEQLSEEQEKLQERIDDELESHNKRLENAREAEAERIADMTEDFARQKALEDEDRALKLARGAEDYAEQLQKMDEQQAQRLAQMDAQYADEKKQLEDNFRNQLKDQALFGMTWLNNQTLWQNEAIKRFERFFKDLADITNNPIGPLTQQEMAERRKREAETVVPFFTDYQSVPSTGPLKTGSSTSTSTQKSLFIDKGGITINVPADTNPDMIGKIVRKELQTAFIALSN